MKLQIQWTTDPPGDWQWIDSSEWASLPFKPEPVGGEIINQELGWVYSLNVQGVLFNGDHYAVEHMPDFVKVYCWNDDSGDFLPDEYYGSAWIFEPIVFDSALGYNTRQELERFGGSHPDVAQFTTKGPVINRNWSSFQKPDEVLIRHGIWVTESHLKLYDVFQPAEWREWIK